MNASYSVSHLSDGALLQNLNQLVAKDRTTTAELLVHLGEVDDRKLYAPAGYSSLFAYCLGELHFSEDVTSKRIHAARAGRTCPALLLAIADGRLNLSGAAMLAPRLTTGNADELIAAATHKTRDEIELLLAHRFPKPNVESRVRPLPVRQSSVAATEHAPGHVPDLELSAESQTGAPMNSHEPAPGQVEMTSPPVTTGAVASDRRERRGRITPLGPKRFAFQGNLNQEGRELVLGL
jgi:hypothetical protein